jgi:hypothetical protein
MSRSVKDATTLIPLPAQTGRLPGTIQRLVKIVSEIRRSSSSEGVLFSRSIQSDTYANSICIFDAPPFWNAAIVSRTRQRTKPNKPAKSFYVRGGASVDLDFVDNPV